MTAPRIFHEYDCTGPELFDTVGRRGDPIVRCRACGRFALASPKARPVAPVAPVEPRPVLDMPRPSRVRPAAAVAVVEPAPAPAPVAVTLASRYRCGGHPDAPVTWKGTGCPECEHEHAARQRDREHAAGARRERAERDRQA